MSDFLITELDDRLEFGMAAIDNDVLNDNNGCTNGGNCCGTNNSNPQTCTNSVNCDCPGCKT
jgi:hypothetical protein